MPIRILPIIVISLAIVMNAGDNQFYDPGS